MSEWKLIGVVAEGEPIFIGGVNLWAHHWERVGSESVELPHPSYPSQTHRMSVFQVNAGGTLIQFAAGELSANVYGFFVPAAQQVGQIRALCAPDS